jgi:dCMP deaminase
MRPERGKMLLEVAQVIAQRGTCDRKQVGAVIAREGRIISVGYNGAPPGLPHCDENNHGWRLSWDTLTNKPLMGRPVDWIERQISEQGCRNATHAEANALAFAAKYGVSTDEAELYVTVSPCETCARLLIAAGILGVHYIERYRDDSGLELLNQALIMTYEWREG